jgi:hypothetical protein
MISGQKSWRKRREGDRRFSCAVVAFNPWVRVRRLHLTGGCDTLTFSTSGNTEQEAPGSGLDKTNVGLAGDSSVPE